MPEPAQASTMQPQHVIAALKDLEFTELADEIEAHQREWDAAERPKGAPLLSPLLLVLRLGCEELKANGSVRDRALRHDRPRL